MNYDTFNPILYFSKYLELIYADDTLWANYQSYVRRYSPHRNTTFFEYQRDPKCIEIWHQMLDNMGGGWPIEFFASVAFLLLAYKDSGHDLDAELQQLHSSGISIVQGDITAIAADCIVNAANSGLHIGSGVCGSIFQAAGEDDMTKACDAIGFCPVGSAVVTPAFKLPAKYVIHAVGPKVGVDENPISLLRSAYLSIMEKVRELGCHSVSVPLLSSGAFNKASYSPESFWNPAISAVRDYQASNPEYPITVTFVCNNAEKVSVGRKVLSSPPAIQALPSYIFFWHEDDEHGYFSQWYKAPFTIEGVSYQTCEQYMMAKKALLFHDYSSYSAIMKEPDPKKDKALGKAVKNYDHDAWHNCNEEIIYNANYAKFSQHPQLKEELLATGNKILVEASPYDRIYGIGLEASDPNAKDPGKWKGKNLLGIVLGRVRESLLNTSVK